MGGLWDPKRLINLSELFICYVFFRVMRRNLQDFFEKVFIAKLCKIMKDQEMLQITALFLSVSHSGTENSQN